MNVKTLSASALALCAAIALWIVAGSGQDQASQPGGVAITSTTNPSGGDIMSEQAVLAGGCFWGIQDLIRKLPGVVETRVGYTGGNVRNATYRNHGTHAEEIEIVFDQSITSYRKLL